MGCSQAAAAATAWEENRLHWETSPCVHGKGLQQGRGVVKQAEIFCLGIGGTVACVNEIWSTEIVQAG